VVGGAYLVGRRRGVMFTTQACGYIRRFADVDTAVLGQSVAGSVAETRRRYGHFARSAWSSMSAVAASWYGILPASAEGNRHA